MDVKECVAKKKKRNIKYNVGNTTPTVELIQTWKVKVGTDKTKKSIKRNKENCVWGGAGR